MSDAEDTQPSSIDPPTRIVSNELILDAVHAVRDEVRSLRDDHDALKKHVYGSKPPPPNDKPQPSIAAQLTDVSDELRRQSSAMGLAGFAEWLASPAAPAKVLRIAGVLSAFYAALHAAGVVK